MMPPTRLSIVTYNLWNIQRWPLREPALRGFFRRYRPDIFCLQELRIQTRDALDDALPDYRRVDDPYPGWERESNIYWNANLLEEVTHGWEDVGIDSDPYRGLFWARLKVKASGQTIFVSTAHFTYQESPEEMQTGQSPRVRQTQRTIQVLQAQAGPHEPAFFMGDLNDAVAPTYLLAQAGYRSCWVRLELCPQPTWPALPTARIAAWNRITTQAMDWIVSNDHARPLIAAVPEYFAEDVAPSDHKPVYAMYELE